MGEDQNWGTDDYRRLWDELDGVDTLDRLLALNLRTYLLDDLLPKVDRATMLSSVEARAPSDLIPDGLEPAVKEAQDEGLRGGVGSVLATDGPAGEPDSSQLSTGVSRI